MAPYVEKLADGQIALLENIRYYKAEEAKDDDDEQAQKEAAARAQSRGAVR